MLLSSTPFLLRNRYPFTRIGGSAAHWAAATTASITTAATLRPPANLLLRASLPCSPAPFICFQGRMSSSSSSRIHHHNRAVASTSNKVTASNANSGKNKAKSKDKNKEELPTERQKTLNKYLGLPLEQIQTRVDSLFKKQDRASSLLAAATVPQNSQQLHQLRNFTTSSLIMRIEASSSDVEQVAPSTSHANGKSSSDIGLDQSTCNDCYSSDLTISFPLVQARSDA